MLNIGCHLSASKGFENMGREALEINANTFQFFTRNPRGGKAKDIDEEDVRKLLKIMEENNFAKILAHAPYTLNLCSADEGIRKFAKDTMADDLKRMEHIKGNLYNFHPGSHVGQGVPTAINQITEILNEVMPEARNTTVLLETMSGKGTEIGVCFEELKAIREKMQNQVSLRSESADQTRVVVGMATCGIASGAKQIMEYMMEKADAMKIRVVFTQTGCMGYCHAEPTIEVKVPGRDPLVFGHVDNKKADEIFEKYILNNEMVDGIIPVNYEVIGK